MGASSVRISAFLSGVAAIVPVLVIAASFPSPGVKPYEWWALICDLAVCIAAFVVFPARYRVLRYGAVVYAVALDRDQARREPARRQREPAQPVRGGSPARLRADGSTAGAS